MSKGSKRRPTDETKIRASSWIPARDRDRPPEPNPKHAELAMKKIVYPWLFKPLKD